MREVALEHFTSTEYYARELYYRMSLAFVDGLEEPPEAAHKTFKKLAQSMGYTVEREE